MPFSLKSLLNPSPDAVTSHAPPPPESARQNSLPSLDQVQTSDDHQQPIQPQTAPFTPALSAHSRAADQEAFHALAALSRRDDPPGTLPPWLSLQERDGARRPSEQGPGSRGYCDAVVQLPPPSPDARKMSSPTLEQYQVASRSPEQRRASIVASEQSAFTLPPLQGFAAAEADQSHAPGAPGEHSASSVHSLGSSARAPESTLNTQIPSADLPDSPSQYTNSSRPPPAHLQLHTSNMAVDSEEKTSPAVIKQENPPTPRACSPIEPPKPSPHLADSDPQPLKIAALKAENGPRTQSPLRESSVPVPSTELHTPELANPKKRPASKAKKGMAVTKKLPAAKKRKVEQKTPAIKKGTSTKGTPATSSPAASARSQSADVEDEEDGDEDDDEEGDFDGDDSVYCICRKPDTGTFMIGCDGVCDDWFHGKCVHIKEHEKDLIDKFICPGCEKAAVGRTTWKRQCGCPGCRQPARIDKGLSKKQSLYCSEDCALAHARERLKGSRKIVFNRDLVAQSRSSRRGGPGLVSAEDEQEDLGSRGGALSVGELKALVNASKTAEDFKKLGSGVLSPPSSPDGKNPSKPGAGGGDGDGIDDFNEEDTTALQKIQSSKDSARARHQLLKDRMKVVTLSKQAASRAAAEKDLKPKDYCGFNWRLMWSESQFELWRSTPTARRALELDPVASEAAWAKSALATDPADRPDIHLEHNFALLSEHPICDRKKCARHLEWPKLAVDDIRFQIADNSDRMRALDRDERKLRERVALRTKAGKGGNGRGEVEIHHDFWANVGPGLRDEKKTPDVHGDDDGIKGPADGPGPGVVTTVETAAAPVPAANHVPDTNESDAMLVDTP